MEKTDRELLEAAAEAIGLRVYDWLPGRAGFAHGDSITNRWNPLEDNGDALRLAVKLGFIVETGRCWVSKYGPMFGEDVLPCAYAATRRAIVRAAAAMAAAPAVGAASPW